MQKADEIRLTSKSVLLNLSTNPAIWVETLTEACFKLAKNRIGALIIIERNDWVDETGDNHYRARFAQRCQHIERQKCSGKN
jgi:DNA integrity scanning protein DisA with diadenylate cyclase activity